MKCLNCSETLVAIEFDALEIDYCLSCAGVWLDAGELEVILEDDRPVQLVETGLPSARSKRRCPVCQRRLSTVSVDKGKRVELDSCPLGHGLWFDRGELHEVAELLGKPLRRAVVERLGAMFDAGSGKPR
jgi:Zn-finger nucleic acid-binding protein